jgi:ABC-type phosphate transport system substrate-binding protein
MFSRCSVVGPLRFTLLVYNSRAVPTRGSGVGPVGIGSTQGEAHLTKLFRFAALGVVALTMTMTFAACGPVPHNVALAGSDTIFGVDGIFAYLYTVTNNAAINPNHDTITDVPPTLGDTVGSLYAGHTFDIQPDATCPGVHYHDSTTTPPFLFPPNGSGSGRAALIADSNGCLDVARSSSYPSGGTGVCASAGDPAGCLEMWAIAIGAVDWATFPGTHAPATLTPAQIKGIYDCGPDLANPPTVGHGIPAITNWNQVGGSNAPIIRYLPQTGSGTRGFFDSKYVGADQNHDQFNCADYNVKVSGHELVSSLPTPQGLASQNGNNVIEENNAANVCTASGAPRSAALAFQACTQDDRPNAIVPYSWDVWTSQGNGLNGGTAVRTTSVLNKVNNIAPSSTSVDLSSVCGAGCFFGNRLVYNATKKGSPQHSNAINFTGVDNTHAGYICSNDGSIGFILGIFGLKQIPLGATPGNHGYPGFVNSHCRLNQDNP